MRRVGRDSSELLAVLHKQCFERPWDAAAIDAVLDHPGAIAFATEGGFILMRQAADEAEVLTLAVVPNARRRGIGAALVRAACDQAYSCRVGAVFLEVAEDNAGARALYARLGFIEAGRRSAYYADGVNAVVMRRALPL